MCFDFLQRLVTVGPRIAAFNTEFEDHSQDPGGRQFAKRCHRISFYSSSVIFSNMSSGGLPGWYYPDDQWRVAATSSTSLRISAKPRQLCRRHRCTAPVRRSSPLDRASLRALPHTEGSCRSDMAAEISAPHRVMAASSCWLNLLETHNSALKFGRL